MLTVDSALSPAQVTQLYAACDASALGGRDFVMLVLLFNCGLSLRELANLQRSYVDLESGWLWAYEGLKDPRPVPLNKRSTVVLQQWLSRSAARNLRYVVGRLPICRSKVSARALRNRIDAIAKCAGIPFSGSQATHSLAWQLYELDPAAHGSTLPYPPQLHMLLPFSQLPPLNGQVLRLIPQPETWRAIPEATPALEKGRRLLDRVGELF